MRDAKTEEVVEALEMALAIAAGTASGERRAAMELLANDERARRDIAEALMQQPGPWWGDSK